jgi:hypothetical protein
VTSRPLKMKAVCSLAGSDISKTQRHIPEKGGRRPRRRENRIVNSSKLSITFYATVVFLLRFGGLSQSAL